MQAKEWKLGVSTISWNKSPETVLSREMFEAYQKGGIDCLEISTNWALYDKINYRETEKLSKEFEIELWSYHLPYMPFPEVDITSKDKHVRDAAFEKQSNYIKKAADIGIKTIVIHPSIEPNAPEDREELIKCTQDSLVRFAQLGEQCGVVLAVENLPRTCIGNCSDDIKKLISVDDRLKVCFDTNHLLIEDNAKFIQALGDKIITTHVSDYNFLNEQHWLPYEGLIDWKQLISLLEKVGYSGPFLYELGLIAPNTIKRRELTYTDFRNNYLALINAQTPEILGKIDDTCFKKIYFETKQF